MVKVYCDKCKRETQKDRTLSLNFILRGEKISFELCSECNDKVIRMTIDNINEEEKAPETQIVEVGANSMEDKP